MPFCYDGFNRVFTPTTPTAPRHKKLSTICDKIAQEFKDVPDFGPNKIKLHNYGNSRNKKPPEHYFYSNDVYIPAMDKFQKSIENETDVPHWVLEVGEANILSRIVAIAYKASMVVLYDIDPLILKHHSFQIECMLKAKTRAEFFDKYLTNANPYFNKLGDISKIRETIKAIKAKDLGTHFLSSENKYAECRKALQKVYICLIFLNIRDMVLCYKLANAMRDLKLQYINVTNISDYDWPSFFQGNKSMANKVPACLYVLAKTMEVPIVHSRSLPLGIPASINGQIMMKRRNVLKVYMSKNILDFIKIAGYSKIFLSAFSKGVGNSSIRCDLQYAKDEERKVEGLYKEKMSRKKPEFEISLENYEIDLEQLVLLFRKEVSFGALLILMDEVLETLKEISNQKKVHGDIRLSNILVSADSKINIMDCSRDPEKYNSSEKGGVFATGIAFLRLICIWLRQENCFNKARNDYYDESLARSHRTGVQIDKVKLNNIKVHFISYTIQSIILPRLSSAIISAWKLRDFELFLYAITNLNQKDRADASRARELLKDSAIKLGLENKNIRNEISAIVEKARNIHPSMRKYIANKLLQRASCYHHVEKYTKCLEVAQQCLKLDPSNMQAMVFVLDCYNCMYYHTKDPEILLLYEKQIEQGITHFTKLVNKSESYKILCSLHLHFGAIYHTKCNYESAIRYYTQAITYWNECDWAKIAKSKIEECQKKVECLKNLSHEHGSKMLESAKDYDVQVVTNS